MLEVTEVIRARPSWFGRYWMYAPLLICILVMLPRLVSPQFGLFDDGRSLAVSQGITHGKWDLSWDINAGRARPVYWAAFAFWYLLAGNHAFWYFLGNLLVFLATTYLLVTLVKAMGGSNIQAFLTGLVFTLSTPVIENVYTLSKGENLQLLLILCVIWLVFTAVKSTRGLKYWLILADATLFIILACFTKENTIVLVPLSLVWWGIAFIGRWRRLTTAALLERVARRLVFTSLVGSGLFYLGRTVMLSSQALGIGYFGQASLGLSLLLNNAIRWGGWMVRDYLWLLPLAVGALVICLARKRWPDSGLWWLALVWMAFWLGLYLPWQFTIGYYLLPFAAGAAVFAGVLLAETIEAFTAHNRIITGVAVLSLILVGGLLLLTQANSYTDASIQLAQDTVNARLLDYIAKNAPPGSQVVVNIRLANEYIEQMQLMLIHDYDRPDLTLVNYQGGDLAQYRAESDPTYFILAELANQPKLTVRMGLDEPTLKIWNANVLPVLASWHEDFQVSASPHILTVDFPRLLCSFIYRENYCSAGTSLVNYRQFLYQWRVFTP